MKCLLRWIKKFSKKNIFHLYTVTLTGTEVGIPSIHRFLRGQRLAFLVYTVTLAGTEVGIPSVYSVFCRDGAGTDIGKNVGVAKLLSW